MLDTAADAVRNAFITNKLRVPQRAHDQMAEAGFEMSDVLHALKEGPVVEIDSDTTFPCFMVIGPPVDDADERWVAVQVVIRDDEKPPIVVLRKVRTAKPGFPRARAERTKDEVRSRDLQ
jgi:hypothetical protein